MLSKIRHIKNVGRFYELMPKGTGAANSNFEKFNLIYADNGTGKTTLGAIIKSLANNDPSEVIKRKTIPGESDCEISINIDNKDCNFLNGKWNRLPDSKFVIFDEEFIDKNIFSTSGVDTAHKRQLFNYVVLGEDNVDKTLRLKELLENKVPNINKEIASIESQLQQAGYINDIKSLLSLSIIPKEDFTKLEATVASQEKQVANSDSIKTHQSLRKIVELTIPDYIEYLQTTIDEITSIESFKAYIKKHQKWVEEGLSIQGDSNSCPYCLQDLTGIEVVGAYKQFFSDACQKLLKQLDNMVNQVNSLLSDDKILLVEQQLQTNKDYLQFWKTIDDSMPDVVDFIIGYSDKAKVLRETLISIISRKISNIFQSVSITKDEASNLEIANQLHKFIDNYNLTIESLNSKIKSIKDQQDSLDDLKYKLHENKTQLISQNIIYYDEKLAQIFKRYSDILKDKTQLEGEIKALRSEINDSSTQLIDKYQKSINKYLKSFGVDYSINKVEQKTDTARKDSLVFKIELKGMVFDPNGSNRVPYSLTNTLSSGDRSTLAFALFMAKLEHTELQETILVFDDPITSLDFFRKQQTSKKIIAICDKAKQIFVLTHSMEFTKLFNHIPVKSKFFKLIKADSQFGVSFTPYNKLSDMCISKYHDEHQAIQTYLSDPNAVDRIEVLRAIRSYVETKLCVYFPELAQLHPSTLGKFIAHLRTYQIDSSYLDDLEIINDSIVVENHGDDPRTDDYANLTDTELRNLCKMATELSAPS